jgi:hypothetical protein
LSREIAFSVARSQQPLINEHRDIAVGKRGTQGTLSVTLSEEQHEHRHYLVQDGIGSCCLTHCTTGMLSGFELMALVPLSKSTEASVQRIHDVLMRFHSQSDREQ